MVNRLSIVITVCVSLVLAACQGRGDTTTPAPEGGFAYAHNIGERELALLDRDYDRVVVDASVYGGLMKMMGVEGKCLDFSDRMKPDVEKVVASKPDLLMLSAYEGADIGKYLALGIPVVECRDFLEPSALGRAEWMRYFGRLWGVGEKADSLFGEVETRYLSLRKSSQAQDGRPSVFFDLLYGSQWYQPAPDSSLGRLVSDAGGMVPFKSGQQGGSLALSAEKVLVEARDADFWLIRAYSSQPLTLDTLARMNPVYSQFKAFKEGRVFVCYTDKTGYFETTAFRPDWLLEDFIKLFKADKSGQLRYFQQVR